MFSDELVVTLILCWVLSKQQLTLNMIPTQLSKVFFLIFTFTFHLSCSDQSGQIQPDDSEWVNLIDKDLGDDPEETICVHLHKGRLT